MLPSLLTSRRAKAIFAANTSLSVSNSTSPVCGVKNYNNACLKIILSLKWFALSCEIERLALFQRNKITTSDYLKRLLLRFSTLKLTALCVLYYTCILGVFFIAWFQFAMMHDPKIRSFKKLYLATIMRPIPLAKYLNLDHCYSNVNLICVSPMCFARLTLHWYHSQRTVQKHKPDPERRVWLELGSSKIPTNQLSHCRPYRPIETRGLSVFVLRLSLGVQTVFSCIRWTPQK